MLLGDPQRVFEPELLCDSCDRMQREGTCQDAIATTAALRRAAGEAFARVAFECSNWVDAERRAQYAAILNQDVVACGRLQTRWRHTWTAEARETAATGQPYLAFCASHCPHAPQRSPPGCDDPGKVLVVGAAPPRSGEWKGIAKPAALSPDGGLAALLEELQYSRREVQGRPAEALQYKQLQDAYHSKCAYHFQADVLPYFCTCPALWWCVGVGTFIHMAKREGSDDPSNPW